MSSKRRKKSQKTGGKKAASTDELGQRAEAALQAGRYRDAITDLKRLLKEESRPEWRTALATAYRGRASELADKGMLKEALAIWENRRQLCPDAPGVPEEILLLLRLGRTRDAMHAYRVARDELDPAELGELRAQVAAWRMGSKLALDEWLPDDDPLVAHAEAAETALQAYCAGDDDAASQAITRIPFRSPYRDWARVFKALLKGAEDRAAGADLLDRIPSGSPFADVAGAARLALLPETTCLQALVGRGAKEQRLVAALRGWPEERLTVLRELSTLRERPEPGQLLRIMNRHRDALGRDWVRRYALPLLVGQLPKGLDWPRQMGWEPVTAFEEALVLAWRAEEKGDLEGIFDAWMWVIDGLRQPSEPEPGSDDALRIALIQRHLDDRWKLAQRGWLSDEVVEQLEASLHYDPDHRPTYVGLVAHYRQNGDLKAARRLLQAALERWPEDLELLNEGVDLALASGALKKAAGYASRVLAVDPINRRARGRLVEAQRGHAHKHVRKGRPDLAAKALDEAREWVREAEAEARIDLARALMSLDEDPGSSRAAINATLERLGGGVTARLELAMEAVQQGRDPRALVKQLGHKKPGRPGQDDLMRLVDRLRQRSQHGEIPMQAINFLESAVRPPRGLDLSRDQYDRACEVLHGVGMEQAREAFAQAGIRQLGRLPILEMHRLEAKYAGPFRLASHNDIDRMEEALEAAEAAGDRRTATRLNDLLDRTTLGVAPEPMGLPALPDDLDVPVEDLDAETLLDLMRQYGGIPEELQRIEELLGRDQMLAILRQALEEGGAGPEQPKPKGGPRGGRPRGKKNKHKGGAAREDEPAGPREHDPGQGDLFE